MECAAVAYEIPFMANNLLDLFSRTRNTFPTSPFPIILIISKLPGPTSTSFTLIELELYVLGKPFGFLGFPGYDDGPRLADKGKGETCAEFFLD